MKRGASVPRKLRPALLAGGVLWLALAFWFASGKSATVDEFPYFGAGLSNIAYLDFRMNPEHPPLIKVFALLPVYFLDRPPMDWLDENGVRRFPYPWYKCYGGDYGFFLMQLSDGHPAGRMLFLARLVPIMIGLIGGWLALLWGRELAGDWLGGAFAAALLLFYPEYLGQSCQLSLDAPMLVGCAAVGWCAWRWWRQPGWRRLALFAVVAGIGSLVKLPVTVYTMLLLVLLAMVSFASGGRVKLPRVLLLGGAAILSIWFCQWAGSCFRYSYKGPGAVIGVENPLIPWRATETTSPRELFIEVCRRYRLLPEASLATLTFTTVLKDWPKFLNGVENTEGFYGYFLVTFLLKTPLAFVAALPVFAWWESRQNLRARNDRGRAWRLQRLAVLCLPFLVILAIVVLSRINIGHRHILFIYFPLSVLLGAMAARWVRGGGVWRAAGVALVVAQIASCLISAPHFSTYFNAIAGNPYGASRFVLDSNTDGGQDLPLLARTLSRFGYTRVNLALWGMNYPGSFGIEDFTLINAKDVYPYSRTRVTPPDPSLPTAISVNHLARMRREHPELYAREPDLLLNSIVLYLPARAHREESPAPEHADQ